MNDNERIKLLESELAALKAASRAAPTARGTTTTTTTPANKSQINHLGTRVLSAKKLRLEQRQSTTELHTKPVVINRLGYADPRIGFLKNRSQS